MTTIAYFPHKFSRVIPKIGVVDPQIIEFPILGVKVMPALRSDLTLPAKADIEFPFGYIVLKNQDTGPDGMRFDLGIIDEAFFFGLTGIKKNDNDKAALAEWAAIKEHADISRKARDKHCFVTGRGLIGQQDPWVKKQEIIPCPLPSPATNHQIVQPRKPVEMNFEALRRTSRVMAEDLGLTPEEWTKLSGSNIAPAPFAGLLEGFAQI